MSLGNNRDYKTMADRVNASLQRYAIASRTRTTPSRIGRE
jgi:hypothetical protein